MEQFTFDTIQYLRPDVAAVEAEIKKLTVQVQNATCYAQVKEAILASDKATEEMETMITVAHIRNTLNTTDAFYEEEMAWIQQTLPVARMTFAAFTKALPNPPLPLRLMPIWGRNI